jgi:hypothetical protein
MECLKADPKFIDPILTDSEAFQGKIEKLISSVLVCHPKLLIDEQQAPPGSMIMQMNTSYALFCLLGFLEEELLPGIITKLESNITRLLEVTPN